MQYVPKTIWSIKQKKLVNVPFESVDSFLFRGGSIVKSKPTKSKDNVRNPVFVNQNIFNLVYQVAS
jgi:hypothetical protein